MVSNFLLLIIIVCGKSLSFSFLFYDFKLQVDKSQFKVNTVVCACVSVRAISTVKDSIWLN